MNLIKQLLDKDGTKVLSLFFLSLSMLFPTLFSCYNRAMNDIELKDGERVNQLFSSDVKIIQNREVFSYSIDSVLLSRFPKLPNRGLIVDLCAGNGAVGLFASTRTKATIVGVEIQERLADMAERSIQLNGLSDRMSMITDDLKNLPHHSLVVKSTLFSVTLPTLKWTSIPI